MLQQRSKRLKARKQPQPQPQYAASAAAAAFFINQEARGKNRKSFFHFLIQCPAVAARGPPRRLDGARARQ
jgi:hypothetical protein